MINFINMSLLLFEYLLFNNFSKKLSQFNKLYKIKDKFNRIKNNFFLN